MAMKNYILFNCVHESFADVTRSMAEECFIAYCRKILSWLTLLFVVSGGILALSTNENHLFILQMRFIEIELMIWIVKLSSDNFFSTPRIIRLGAVNSDRILLLNSHINFIFKSGSIRIIFIDVYFHTSRWQIISFSTSTVCDWWLCTKFHRKNVCAKKKNPNEEITRVQLFFCIIRHWIHRELTKDDKTSL